MTSISLLQIRKQHRIRNLCSSVCILLVALATAAAMREDTGDTTVILVRHAEKAVVSSDDPPLSEAGRKRAAALRHVLEKAGVSAIYATQYQRTQQTVEPLAKAMKVTTAKVDAAKPETLVSEIRQRHRGKTVVVAGHSNTIPEIIDALGAPNAPDIEDADFNDLFVVSIPKTGPVRLLHMQYGAAD